MHPPPLLTVGHHIRTPGTHRLVLGNPHYIACRVAGGSAANVAKALAHLRPAASVSFVSQVGADDAGAAYRQGLTDAGVRPLLLESRTGLPSSTCLCLVCELPPLTVRRSTHMSAADHRALSTRCGHAAGARSQTAHAHDPVVVDDQISYNQAYNARVAASRLRSCVPRHARIACR